MVSSRENPFLGSYGFEDDFSNRFINPNNSGSDAIVDFSTAVEGAKSLGGSSGYSYSDFPDDAFVQSKWQSRDEPITDSYTSQFSKMIDAANKAQMWKKLTSGGGYKGGFAQGMGGNPLSGGSYQSLGKGKGIFQYDHAKPFAIVNHPQKQKSGGFSIGGAVKGLVAGLSTGIPHMGAVGAVAGGFA